jgi:hypothetical protein
MANQTKPGRKRCGASGDPAQRALAYVRQPGRDMATHRRVHPPRPGALISIASDAGIGYPPAASASGSSRMRLWVDRKGGHLVDGESELCVCGTHFAEDIYDLTRERVGVNDRQELESGTTRV